MTAIILDRYQEEKILADRRAKGWDRYDEVWNGVYVMSPLPESFHQKLVGNLQTYLTMALEFTNRGEVFPGLNISDRSDDWRSNYRCPDIAVYLRGTTAKNCGAYWVGGPDFAIEIISSGDRTWEKLDFYASIKTRELLIVDRDPWELTLLQLADEKLKEAGRATIENQEKLASQVVPFSFGLVSRSGWPTIELRHTDGQVWYAPAQTPSPAS